MKRLIDDPQIAGELRTEMQRYATEQAQVDLKRVYAGLQASLPLTAAALSSAPRPRFSRSAWSGLPSTTKLLIVAALGGTVALGIGALRGEEHAAQRSSTPAAAIAAPSTSAQPEAELAAANAAVPQPTAALTPTATNERTVATSSDLASATAGGLSSTRAGLPSSGPSSSLMQPQPRAADTTSSEVSRASRTRANTSSASRREIAQLARIKALLEQDPAAARRLIRAAQREFPAGLLVEEREGLDVIALFALKETERARKNAQRFVARYPQSPLRPKLERLLADASE